MLVTIPPLYSFAKNVAGDDAAVLCLLTETGPHDYQYNPRDAVLVQRANLVLLNGLELDDFTMNLVRSSYNKKVPLLEVGETLPEGMLLPMAHDHHHGHHGEGDHGHHHHGAYDPHVWLGIPQAVVMVRKIAEKLQEVDPKHADGYGRRAEAYVKELEALHREGKEALKGKKNRKLITMHESLGYFAKAFDLEVAGSIQIKAGVEPEPAQRARLVKLCKEEGVRVIAVEPQYSQDSARLLQDQVRRMNVEVEVVEIDPMETAPAGLGADFYLTKMRQNVRNLAAKLP